MDRNSKKQQDRFRIIIIGIIVYSIVLMLVMAGTYLGVKSMFIHREEEIENELLQMQAKAEEERLAQEEEALAQAVAQEEEEPLEEEIEEVVEDTEIVPNEHEIDLSLLYDSDTGYIDFTKSIFKPGARKNSLEWHDNVVSRIEKPDNPEKADINTYTYKRIKKRSTEHADVELNVFTNPETKMPEKIHVVMNTGKSIETLDMYYDKGNINYVAHEKTTVDKPEDIKSMSIDARYYFRDDALVKYIYTADGVATGYSLEDMGSYSSDVVNQYDILEEKMINMAYISYNIGKKEKEIKKIYGYVVDEYGTSIPGASVTLYKGSSDREVQSLEANGDGMYTFELEPDDLYDYSIAARVDGMTEGHAYHISVPKGSGDYYVAPIYVSYLSSQVMYNVQILIRDATDPTKPMANASIKIREGVNNTSGTVLLAGTLNDGGGAVVPMIGGSFTAQIDMEGYETSYVPLNVRANHIAVLGYCVPTVYDDNVKIVCSWETSPLDLDCLAISSNKKRVIKKDFDSIGTMAEVISIDNLGIDDYRMYMYDHGSCIGNDPMSYNMSNANATVAVYLPGGYWGTLTVPTSHAGVVWEALRIRDQKVLPVNSYYYTIEENSYWTSK